MGNISLRGLIFVIMFFFLIAVGVISISTCGKKTSVDSVKISNSIPQLRSPSHIEPEKLEPKETPQGVIKKDITNQGDASGVPSPGEGGSSEQGCTGQ